MTKDDAINKLKALELQDEELNKDGYELAMKRYRGKEQIAVLNKIIEGYDAIEQASKEFTESTLKNVLDDVKKSKSKKPKSFVEEEFISLDMLDD